MNNITNLTNLTFRIYSNPADICKVDNAYSPECLKHWFCPQFPAYIVHYGIGIIVFWVVFSWAWDWFKKHGVYKINWDYLILEHPKVYNWLGDLREEKNLIYWEFFIKDKFIKFCLGFIAVMVYLNWG